MRQVVRRHIAQYSKCSPDMANCPCADAWWGSDLLLLMSAYRDGPCLGYPFCGQMRQRNVIGLCVHVLRALMAASDN